MFSNTFKSNGFPMRGADAIWLDQAAAAASLGFSVLRSVDCYLRVIICRNSANRGVESCGPGEASG